MLRIKLIFALLLLQYNANVDAVDYQLEFVNEEIFSRCQEHPKNFIDKWFDISAIKYEFTADDNIRFYGPLKFIGDIPKDRPIQLIVTTYKEQRGAWTNTALNLKYENLCDSVYNPNEHWYSVTKAIPEDKRSCPPAKGWEINLDNEATVILKNMKVRDADGSYRAVATIAYGQKPNEFICFEILVNAHLM